MTEAPQTPQAAGAGVLGIRKLQEAPLPLPVQTVREASGAVAGAASTADRDQASTAAAESGQAG